MKNLFLFVFSGLAFFIQAQEYNITNIPGNLVKNANVVVRNSSSQYNIKSFDEIQILENHTYTILNKSGDVYATIVIPYDKRTKVEDIKVNVYDAVGKIVKTYSKRDFSDYAHTPSFGFYVDDRILVLKPTSLNYPYSIGFSYKLSSKNTAFISDFTPLLGFNVSAQNVSRKIINESGVKLRTKIISSEIGTLNKNESGNTNEYSFSNVPAIEKEPLSPSFSKLETKVEFALEKFSLEGKPGVVQNWDDFGKWYYQNLIEPSAVVTEAIKAEVNALGLTGTTEEKVKKIFQYMQNKTRYVLVAIGIGGWQPANSEEVRQKGYGDCKGLTNYMRALLLAADIPSNYSLIKSNASPEKFDPSFPKMGGNHAILMVPTENGNIWLENTSQTIAFNHLSYNTTNRNVQAVKENGIEIINTPVYPAEKSKETIKANVKLQTDQSITTTANFSYSGGQYDFMMPLVQLTAKNQIDAINSNLSYLNISTLEMVDFKNDRDKAVISYQANIDARDYSKKIGEDFFFRVMPFFETGNVLENIDRTLPFETAFAYQDDYEIVFEAPSGYQFSSIPNAETVNSDFGSYKILYNLVDGKLEVKRTLTIKHGSYPKEKYQNYIEFRKKTAKLDNTKILFTKI